VGELTAGPPSGDGAAPHAGPAEAAAVDGEASGRRGEMLTVPATRL
jgi:hypothetical protein